MSSSSNPSELNSSNSKLQIVNYANVLAYISNVGVTYGVGVSGYFPTNKELSAKYQTLVTPAGYAFAIWGVIFISQFIWVILQLLPKFRSSDLVIKGVGFWYVGVCVAQCAWSIFFASEWITVSLGAMLSILVCLVTILINSTAIPAESVANFWGFKFPFQIHCGWIWAASLVNANVVVVAQEVSASYQEISAWVSLGLLTVVGLSYTSRKNYVVPVVLSWASYAISQELAEPRDSIANTFAAETVQQLQRTSLGLAIGIVVAVMVQVGLQWRSSPNASNSDDNNNNASGAGNNASSSNYSPMGRTKQ